MFKTVQRKVGAFRRSESGNVAAIFALSLLPLVGFAGAAVDYSRAATVRSRIQSAVDATALKLARDGALLSDSDFNAMANRYFGAVLDTTDLPAKPVLHVQRTPENVSLSADVGVPTVLMQTLGVTQVPVGAASVGAFDTTKIELSLVLDNTGSMAQQGKMAALKDALVNSSTGILTQIKSMDPAGTRVKVAIVPFDTQVNVGSNYLTKIGNSYQKPGWIGFNDLNSSFTSPNDPAGKKSAAADATWTGCLSDRADPYNTSLNTPTTSVTTTLYPAWACDTLDSKKQPMLGKIQPLTNDMGALTATVNAMQPSGNTNVTIGFHWGMRMLESGTTPLGLGAPFGTANVRKYLVLLTDGDNTQDRFSTSQGQIDNRTQTMCNAIKGNGNVVVFTVRVIDGNATLLKNCATTPTSAIPQTYFEVKNSTGISAALNTILQQITAIRLTS